VRATLLRPRAGADLIERTHHYRREGGDRLGARFFDAAIATLGAIGRMPGAGSPSVGELCGIPGLRVRRVTGFPCGWFYFVAQNHVDVVRLLADAQDLPTILADADE
jgi:toxin ParE1/3/4